MRTSATLTDTDTETETASWSPAFAARPCHVLRFLLSAIFLILTAGSLRATIVDPPDFATLVSRADVIFSGEVTEVKCEWVGQGDQRHIESFVSFKILRMLKGAPAKTFLFNMVGGTVGDRTLEIDGAPKFKAGDRAVLFVEKNGVQVIPLVGMMHGRYRIATDSASGDDVIFKNDGAPLGGIEEIDAAHARGPFPDQAVTRQESNAAIKPMKCTDFENAIARQVRSKG